MVDYVIQNTPLAASRIYSLDGTTIPKKKSLFYIRFVRTDNAQTTTWSKNIGFFAKTVERPAVQPQVEELNQYNKKRHIITGVKYNPISINFYDTQDGAAFAMWNEYAKYHFGDFGQFDENQFRYDITTEKMLDNGSGFGYQPRDTGDDSLDLNSGYFFDAVEVYQVFQNSFTQYDLINPKITAFTPDELTYETHEIANIAITLVYDAILYRNDGQPLPISSNEFVKAAFDTAFAPNLVDEYDNSASTSTMKAKSGIANIAQAIRVLNFVKDIGYGVKSGQFANELKTQPVLTTASGILKTFGKYSFGSTQGMTGDSSYSKNSQLNSILTGIDLARNTQSTVERALTPSGMSPSISGGIIDEAVGAFGSGATNSPYGTNYINSTLSSGVMASSILTNTSSGKQVIKEQNGDISLSGAAYSALNLMGKSSVQLGKKI